MSWSEVGVNHLRMTRLSLTVSFRTIDLVDIEICGQVVRFSSLRFLSSSKETEVTSKITFLLALLTLTSVRCCEKDDDTPGGGGQEET